MPPPSLCHFILKVTLGHLAESDTEFTWPAAGHHLAATAPLPAACVPGPNGSPSTGPPWSLLSRPGQESRCRLSSGEERGCSREPVQLVTVATINCPYVTTRASRTQSYSGQEMLPLSLSPPSPGPPG